MLSPSVCVPLHSWSGKSVMIFVGVELDGLSTNTLIFRRLSTNSFHSYTSHGKILQWYFIWPQLSTICINEMHTTKINASAIVYEKILSSNYVYPLFQNLKISFLLSGNLKYERLISLFERLAQPGTQQKCTIATIIQNNVHAPFTVFSNYLTASNEYVPLSWEKA